MKIVLFTVADPNIGLGHLVRCDALAQALMMNNINAELIVDCHAGREWLAAKPLSSNWQIVNWTQNIQNFASWLQKCEIPVIDGYNIDERIWNLLQESDRKVVLFDDYGEKPELKGILINGSPGAPMIPYRKIPHRKLLLGYEYQVLRPPFWKTSIKSVNRSVRSVGVLLGGTDHRKLSSAIIQTLKELLPLGTIVHIIGQSSDQKEFDDLVVTGILNAEGMYNLFNSLDLLICGGGQTVPEAVACSLPAVIMCLADNQKLNYQSWINTGAVIPAGVIVGDLGNFIGSGFQTAVLRGMEYKTRNECVRIAESLNLSKSTENVCMEIRELQE